MQPVFLGERGERKVSHGLLLMESPALKLELSTTKNASVELLFEISILIKIQPRPHANCNLKILFILLLLICYICCKTDEVFCFAAHLSRTTDLPSFYPKRLDHRAHSALGYLEKYKSFTQQYSGLIDSKIKWIIRPPHDL